MNHDATSKIRMLKNSRHCFVFGVLGLLPLIGLPFALVALVFAGNVRVQERRFWNAAKPYRIWGVTCAAMGTIFWASILASFLYHAATSH